MTSSRKEINDAIIEAASESKELRAILMSVPERVEKTVEEFTPVLTGETVKSIETAHRKTPYRKLSTRRIKIGEVYSTSDPERVAAIEYGRHEGNSGETEGAFMFKKTLAVWEDVDL